MKRKLLNGLLLATAFAGVGTLQSCKDYESDLQAEWRQGDLSLQEKVDLLNGRLNELEETQRLCKQECEKKIADILKTIGGWENFTQDTDLEGHSITYAVQAIMFELDKLKDHQHDINPGQELTKGDIFRIINEWAKNYGWPTDENGNIQPVDFSKVDSLMTDVADLYAKYRALATTIQEVKDYTKNLSLRIYDLEHRIKMLENHEHETAANWTEEQIRQMAEEEARKQIDALQVILQQQLEDLRLRIDTNNTNLNNRIDNLLTLFNSLEVRLTIAERNALSALAQAQTNADAIYNLQYVMIPAMQASIDALQNRVDIMDRIQTQTIEQLNALSTRLSNLEAQLISLLGRVDDLDKQFADLRNKYEELDMKLFGLETRVNQNQTNIAYLLDVVTTLATKEDLDALTLRVAQNESDILALQGDMKKVLKIYDRLNSLVTGVIVEGTFNPLFGTFSLPIGVESNMLFNYYGRYEGAKTLTFPSVGSNTNTTMLTAEEKQLLNGLYTPTTIENGQYLMDGNLGKLYLTINPSNVDLSGVDLVLTQSNGVDIPVLLTNVKKSNEVLKFGVSRGDNNFYEADAVLALDGASINAVKIEVSDGLKSSVKNLLKDRTKHNLFELMRGVYDQLAQGLPAYSVKHSWTVDDGNGLQKYSVLSGYDLAATTVKPLSFNTYKGESINKKLNHHGPLRSVKDLLNDFINKDKFHFSLSTTIQFKDVSATFALHPIEDLYLSYNGEIYAKTSGVDIYDDNGNVIGHTGPLEIPVSTDDMNAFLAEISNQIMYEFNKEGGYLEIWDNQMEQEFNRAIGELTANVQSEVDRALKDMSGQINDQIDDILDDLINDISGKTQKFVDKFNSFLDKYNKVVDKVNHFLEDPNHYLQVAMVYHAGGARLELLSNDANDPTMLTKKGGNAIEMFATTYTAEIAAPAYQKFIAITGGWKTGDKSQKLTTPEVRALNMQGSMCKVLPGRAKRVALPAGSFKSGYTYEILYTAVDFHGYTSTQHFYVSVK